MYTPPYGQVQSVSIICRLRTADCRPDWVQNADWGYKMQTEDKMQTGGELGIFYKFPPSHSHVIVLVDILMLKLVTLIKMDEEDSDVEVFHSGKLGTLTGDLPRQAKVKNC
jgi:hypothetical protein